MSIDPTILSFALRLARIKSRQLARVLPGADALDLQQDLLLAVVDGWQRFDAERGRAEAFVEHLMAQCCWKLRRCRFYVSRPGTWTQEVLERTPLRDSGASINREKVQAVRMAVARMPHQYVDACRVLCDSETVSRAARRLDIPRSTLDSLIVKVRHSLAAATGL